MVDTAKLQADFARTYGTEPRIFRAPGRVNLIGEHTDYNDGFVLPAALNFATYIAAVARTDRRIRARSLGFDAALDFKIDDIGLAELPGWGRYVAGVAAELEAEGFEPRGADILIDSDIPSGAGLSSSAALCVSLGFAFAALAGREIDGMQLARLGRTVEHKYAGVRTGIMDQFASVFGRKDHALFLDCRTLCWSAVPANSGRFVISNTRTKHDLVESEYNVRRFECEAAAAFFGCSSLRDVEEDEFLRRYGEMPEIPAKRARHILSENHRVLSAVDALRESDDAALGLLMNSSHVSLRDDFEISSRELDIMVEIAWSHKDVLGSRMTGGGFGGCTITLLRCDDPRDFMDFTAREYEQQTRIRPEIYACTFGDGVAELT